MLVPHDLSGRDIPEVVDGDIFPKDPVSRSFDDRNSNVEYRVLAAVRGPTRRSLPRRRSAGRVHREAGSLGRSKTDRMGVGSRAYLCLRVAGGGRQSPGSSEPPPRLSKAVKHISVDQPECECTVEVSMPSPCCTMRCFGRAQSDPRGMFWGRRARRAEWRVAREFPSRQ